MAWARVSLLQASLPHFKAWEMTISFPQDSTLKGLKAQCMGCREHLGSEKDAASEPHVEGNRSYWVGGREVSGQSCPALSSTTHPPLLLSPGQDNLCQHSMSGEGARIGDMWPSWLPTQLLAQRPSCPDGLQSTLGLPFPEESPTPWLPPHCSS